MPPLQRARINPILIRWARESILMSLDQAASRIHVPPARIRSWESGEAQPTVRQAQAAASAYRRPFATFFLSEPPADDPPPPDFRRLPGGGRPTTSPELAVEIRRAHFRRDAALGLLRSLELDAPDPGSIAGEIERAEEDAVEVRQRLGITIQPQPRWSTQYEALNAWKDAIEISGVLVFHFSGVEVAEARGFSIASRPLPAVALNGEDAPYGRIFTLMHEFAHVLAGEAGNCNLVDYFENDQGAAIERYCNAVAAAVLMPRTDFLEHPIVSRHQNLTDWSDLELTALSTAYRVSREAALRRLLTLGRTTRDFYRSKRRELVPLDVPPSGGGFLTWPQRAIRSSGHLFGGLVLDAYHREAITSADLTEYFGVRIKHLPEIERRLEGRNMLTGGRP